MRPYFHNNIHDCIKYLFISLFIENHIIQYPAEYVIYKFTKADLLRQIQSYTYRIDYNSNFGDLVPQVISQLLNISLAVLDTNGNGEMRRFSFKSPFPNLLTLHSQGDHYNGIIHDSTRTLKPHLSEMQPVTLH